MKNYNSHYGALKASATSLKNQHFELSGTLELAEGLESAPIYTKVIQRGYTRYKEDWQNFLENLKYDVSQRGYNTDKVLKQFPEPDLPEETVTVGESGVWVSFDG